MELPAGYGWNLFKLTINTQGLDDVAPVSLKILDIVLMCSLVALNKWMTAGKVAHW